MDQRPLNMSALNAFAAVMSAGSITGAARLLGKSQPVVTRLIQELEAELGFVLFHRNGPRISPTERGVLFHEEVERLLSGLNHIRERARAIAEEEIRPIEIIATSALATGLIPAALALMDPASSPGQTHLKNAPAEKAVQSVLSHSADVGVCSLPIDHPGLEIHWFGRAPAVAVVAEDSPLAQQAIVSIADLQAHRLITMANPYRLRARIDLAFARAGIAPDAALVTDSSLSAIMAARAGIGIAIVEPATAYGVPIRGVAVRPLGVDIPFLWGVFTAAGRPTPTAVDAFITALEQASRATLPEFTLHTPEDMDAFKDLLFGSPPERRAARHG